VPTLNKNLLTYLLNIRAIITKIIFDFFRAVIEQKATWTK